MYTKLAFVLALIIGLLGFASASSPPTRPAPEVVIDSGQLVLETNAKLDKVNANLEEISRKLDALTQTLGSGKLEVVVVREKVAPAAAAAAESK